MLECPCVDKIRGHICRIRHPLAAIVIAGLAIHLLIMLLAMVYDSDYWAIVIRNINAGEGLYGMEGYYYTPVWGYILGLVSAFQNAFLSLGDSAVRVFDVIYFEASGHQTSATVTSLVFNYCTKLPLLICDVILAYLTYVLVDELKHDRKKATLAFALVFLCPVIIGSTGIIGMPDTLAATFMMLSLLLVIKNRSLLAGMCFAMAVLTKFFPVFLFFPLVAYVLARNRDDRRKGYMQVVMAAIGAISVMAVIFLPQIMAGDLFACFQFLTDRSGTSAESTLLSKLMGYTRILAYVLVIIASVLVARSIYRTDADNLEKALLRGSMIVLALCLLYPPATQYIVVLVPLLAYYIAAENYKYIRCWKLLAIGATIVFMVSLSTHLLPLAVSTGLIEISSLEHFFDIWNSGAGVFTVWNIEFVIGSILQYAGILVVLLMAYGRYLNRLFGGGRSGKAEGNKG